MKISTFYLAPLCVALSFIVSCSSDSSDGEIDKPILTGDIGDIENIQIFPINHPLNKDISNSPVDANSNLILSNIGLNKGLFPDFGSGEYQGAPIGIPYVSVDGSQLKVPITFGANSYGDESDKGPFPIPLDAPIEGNGVGDSHVISVDVENGMLYELYNTSQVGSGFEVSSAAVFDLNKVEFRPDGWTSADAAGLPILPLLVRYPEVEKGEIDHPIRFTINRSKIYEGYVHPARHLVSGNTGDELLPFGGRLRLKADYDISGFSKTNQIILTAMKKYGLMLADVGSDMFITGAPHEKWDNDDLKKLLQVTLDNFEVIELGDISLRN
ncbi:hypothetical protein A8C32_15335 [Flavivirga aquatica]|uniref:Uncharacterized protein n=1 Tax=Flavivirga aquatica TaxID=1849968 RepID=A0A1E5T901_9FLAO|nr:hypothetical protein [Flavivirga aquatica]OEK07853.1 hypothetical protein A8C32_15335 [Flavivirga aquatica]